MKTHCYNCTHFLPRLFYCSFWGYKLTKGTIDRLSNEGCVHFEFAVDDKK